MRNKTIFSIQAINFSDNEEFMYFLDSILCMYDCIFIIYDIT